MKDKILFLQKLIQIHSVNDNEAEMANLVADEFAKHGIDSKFIEYESGRSSLVAEVGNDESDVVLGFTGHLDTVATGNEELWTYPPFSGEIVDGRMYGRGTTDMLASVAAFVFSMIELNKMASKNKVRLLLTVGEEDGAFGSEQLTELGYVDDLSALVVGEPTSQKIIFAHNGSCTYTVKSFGKQVHSSMPEKGVNALEALTEFYQKEKELFKDFPTDKHLGKVVHSVTMLHGGDQVNTIPGYAELRGNIRPIPGLTKTKVLSELNGLINQIDGNLELQINFFLGPIKTEENAKIIKLAKDAFASEFDGAVPPLDVIHGATDASNFTLSKNKFDVILLGAGIWEMAHQVDEYVDLDEFEKMINVYTKIALDY